MPPLSQFGQPVADLEAIKALVKQHYPDQDLELLDRAYQTAHKCHKGQTRKSGDPYITHPLAVAYILAKLEQDLATVAGGLLHDVIEDSKMTCEDLQKKFGDDIAHLVNGVTKLGQFSYNSREEQQAESFRKMFLAMAKDLRVIIIKLADRLHNMQTLKYLSPQKQGDIAKETREIYAPLAHRMGMWTVKWELDDLAFMYLQPVDYQKIRTYVNDSRQNREHYVDELVEKIKQTLKDNKLEAEITGRPKHFFSIYQKMLNQELTFDQMYDLLAVRIIVKSLRDCYAALGVIHSAWKPLSGRFKDYIAMPKTNMYQSLHTAIIGPYGKPVEVQIRTHEMHKVAEYGIAAHWKYKSGNVKDSEYENKLAWIRQLVDWQKDTKDAKTFLDNLRIDLFEDEVFVFTPKGAVRPLPMNSTPVDFAYAIHSEIGNTCTGAKVNGVIVSLSHALKNGDIVEIITQKNAHPNIDWLNFVKTTNAKARIKSFYRKMQRDEHLHTGKTELVKALLACELKPEEVMTEKYFKVLLDRFKLADEETLYTFIAHGEISARSAAQIVKDYHEKLFPKTTEWVDQIITKLRSGKHKNALGIEIEGLQDIEAHLAKCCRPLPGDSILGFITMGHGVSIHRNDCVNVAQVSDELSRNRMVSARWLSPNKDSVYPVEVEIKGFDRVGLLNDILSKISQNKTNIREANVRTARDTGTVIANLVVDIHSAQHLGQLLASVRSVDDVLDAHRVLS